MEAVPRMPMLAFELKQSPEFVEFGPTLKQYIRDHYGEDPAHYNKSCNELEQLRQSAVHVSHDFMGCSTLKKYYAQLQFLQGRFPMTELGEAAIPFTWEDVHSGREISLNDIKFEQASILYNIGALHSILGSMDTRQSADGMKVSCTHFQCASWAFEHLRDHFGCAGMSLDMSHELLTFQVYLMLAQAQECILEKSMTDSRKSTITAKVAAQIVEFYTTALRHLDTCNTEELISSKRYKEWKKRIDIKVLFYTCITNYYQGRQAEDQQKWGQCLAFHTVALNKLADCQKLAKTGRGVPVIIPRDLKEALQHISCERVRKAAGVVPSKYLFTRPGGEPTNVMRAYECLAKACQLADLEYPERITSTSLRKYMATITQNESSDIQESLRFTHDVVGGKHQSAKKDNDFVYHEKVPELDSLPEVKGASLVKGIPFNASDPDISGPDIFMKLVPMSAHEASSLYSEEKATLLRRISSEITERDEELNRYLASLQLDQTKLNPEPERLPQQLLEKCAAISVRPSAIKDLVDSMAAVSSTSTDVDMGIKEIQQRLQDESKAELEYQEKFGKRAPNIILSEIAKECSMFEEGHRKGSQSNTDLHKAMNTHINNLKLLSSPLEDLQKLLPSLDKERDAESSDIIKELNMLLSKVEEMRGQRNTLNEKLRKEILDDDITGALCKQEDVNREVLFAEQLKKHDETTSLIRQNLSAQGNILRALTDANARYASVRKATSETVVRRDQMIRDLVNSYDVYEDLMAKSQKGLEFYRKLETNVSRLLSRCKGVCQVQQEEREMMYQRMKPKAAPPVRPGAPKPSPVVASPHGPSESPMAPQGGHHLPREGSPQMGVPQSQAGVPQPVTAGVPPMFDGPKLKDYLPFMKPKTFGKKDGSPPVSRISGTSQPGGSLPNSGSASPVHLPSVSGSVPASPDHFRHPGSQSGPDLTQSHPQYPSLPSNRGQGQVLDNQPNRGQGHLHDNQLYSQQDPRFRQGPSGQGYTPTPQDRSAISQPGQGQNEGQTGFSQQQADSQSQYVPLNQKWKQEVQAQQPRGPPTPNPSQGQRSSIPRSQYMQSSTSQVIPPQQHGPAQGHQQIPGSQHAGQPMPGGQQGHFQGHGQGQGSNIHGTVQGYQQPPHSQMPPSNVGNQSSQYSMNQNMPPSQYVAPQSLPVQTPRDVTNTVSTIDTPVISPGNEGQGGAAVHHHIQDQAQRVIQRDSQFGHQSQMTLNQGQQHMMNNQGPMPSHMNQAGFPPQQPAMPQYQTGPGSMMTGQSVAPVTVARGVAQVTVASGGPQGLGPQQQPLPSQQQMYPQSQSPAGNQFQGQVGQGQIPIHGHNQGQMPLPGQMPHQAPQPHAQSFQQVPQPVHQQQQQIPAHQTGSVGQTNMPVGQSVGQAVSQAGSQASFMPQSQFGVQTSGMGPSQQPAPHQQQQPPQDQSMYQQPQQSSPQHVQNQQYQQQQQQQQPQGSPQHVVQNQQYQQPQQALQQHPPQQQQQPQSQQSKPQSFPQQTLQSGMQIQQTQPHQQQQQNQFGQPPQQPVYQQQQNQLQQQQQLQNVTAQQQNRPQPQGSPQHVVQNQQYQQPQETIQQLPQQQQQQQPQSQDQNFSAQQQNRPQPYQIQNQAPQQGQMPQRQMPQGQMPQGQMPQGQMPQGQMLQGQMPQSGLQNYQQTPQSHQYQPQQPLQQPQLQSQQQQPLSVQSQQSVQQPGVQRPPNQVGQQGQYVHGQVQAQPQALQQPYQQAPQQLPQHSSPAHSLYAQPGQAQTGPRFSSPTSVGGQQNIQPSPGRQQVGYTASQNFGSQSVPSQSVQGQSYGFIGTSSGMQNVPTQGFTSQTPTGVPGPGHKGGVTMVAQQQPHIGQGHVQQRPPAPSYAETDVNRQATKHLIQSQPSVQGQGTIQGQPTVQAQATVSHPAVQGHLSVQGHQAVGGQGYPAAHGQSQQTTQQYPGGVNQGQMPQGGQQGQGTGYHQYSQIPGQQGYQGQTQPMTSGVQNQATGVGMVQNQVSNLPPHQSQQPAMQPCQQPTLPQQPTMQQQPAMQQQPTLQPSVLQPTVIQAKSQPQTQGQNLQQPLSQQPLPQQQPLTSQPLTSRPMTTSAEFSTSGGTQPQQNQNALSGGQVQTGGQTPTRSAMHGSQTGSSQGSIQPSTPVDIGPVNKQVIQGRLPTALSHSRQASLDRQLSTASSLDEILSSSPDAKVERSDSLLAPKVLTAQEIQQQKEDQLKNSSLQVQQKDPYKNRAKLDKFVAEVEKLAKFIEGFEKPSCSGPTPLDVVWKEVMEEQEKAGRSQTLAIARCYPMKNRDQDIMPYDDSRVLLTSLNDDYINASWMNDLSPSCPKFITTQSPLPVTLTDFWLMVYEQGVEVLVALSSESEVGKKFPAYVPQDKGESMDHGPIQLTLQSVKHKPFWTERIIHLRHCETKTGRTLVHLHYNAWPISGFPDKISHILQFITEVHSFYRQQRSLLKPIVVQCSNGIGRTGMFQLIYVGMQEINHGDGVINVPEVVSKMVHKRRNVIPKKDQLKFCYEAILYYAQDVLAKQGILVHKAQFGDQLPKPGVKSQSWEPGEDILFGSMSFTNLQSNIAKLSTKPSTKLDTSTKLDDRLEMLKSGKTESDKSEKKKITEDSITLTDGLDKSVTLMGSSLPDVVQQGVSVETDKLIDLDNLSKPGQTTSDEQHTDQIADIGSGKPDPTKCETQLTDVKMDFGSPKKQMINPTKGHTVLDDLKLDVEIMKISSKTSSQASLTSIGSNQSERSKPASVSGSPARTSRETSKSPDVSRPEVAAMSLTELQDPAKFDIGTGSGKRKITKADFSADGRKVVEPNPDDPLSSLDPFWSLK